MQDFWYIWNAEDDRVDGPYSTKEDAENASSAINHFILPQLLKDMGATVKGPWYAVPWSRLTPSQQREMTRLYSC